MVKIKGEEVVFKAVRDEFKHDIGAELACGIVAYIQQILETCGIENVTEREAEAARCMGSTILTAMTSFRDEKDIEGCTALYVAMKQTLAFIEREMDGADEAEEAYEPEPDLQIPKAFGAKVAGRSDN